MFQYKSNICNKIHIFIVIAYDIFFCFYILTRKGGVYSPYIPLKSTPDYLLFNNYPDIAEKYLTIIGEIMNMLYISGKKMFQK